VSFLDHQYGEDDQSAGAIASALRDVLPRHAVVLAPGGLADEPLHPSLPEPHPDHIAVRSAALEPYEDGYGLAVYADLPHANARGWPTWVLRSSPAVRKPAPDARAGLRPSRDPELLGYEVTRRASAAG
jgi:hypothetical protein